MRIARVVLLATLSVSFAATCAFALTESWTYELSATTGMVYEASELTQIIPDGAGGVACSYTLALTNNYLGMIQLEETSVILWLNAKGAVVYKKEIAQTGYTSYPTILAFSKNQLMYQNGDPSGGCTAVNAKGLETPVPNSIYHDNFWSVPQPLLGDKTGFFALRYTGSNYVSSAKLVRFLYK